jgi:hypothetical protein
MHSIVAVITLCALLEIHEMCNYTLFRCSSRSVSDGQWWQHGGTRQHHYDVRAIIRFIYYV